MTSSIHSNPTPKPHEDTPLLPTEGLRPEGLAAAAGLPQAVGVAFSESNFTVFLRDGRYVAVPIEWYPRLAVATSEQRRNFRLIGGGTGIHWPEVDEDVRVGALLEGRPSMESQAHLNRWYYSHQRRAWEREQEKLNRKHTLGSRIGQGVRVLALVGSLPFSLPYLAFIAHRRGESFQTTLGRYLEP